MTASTLAGELRLPLFTIQLDALITKFMGETAAKLRLVFDQMKSIRGTYLFDEFDSIGAKVEREITMSVNSPSPKLISSIYRRRSIHKHRHCGDESCRDLGQSALSPF